MIKGREDKDNYNGAVRLLWKTEVTVSWGYPGKQESKVHRTVESEGSSLPPTAYAPGFTWKCLGLAQLY